jgi:hypothetical protein
MAQLTIRREHVLPALRPWFDAQAPALPYTCDRHGAKFWQCTDQDGYETFNSGGYRRRVLTLHPCRRDHFAKLTLAPDQLAKQLGYTFPTLRRRVPRSATREELLGWRRVARVRDARAAFCQDCGYFIADDCPFWSLGKSVGLHTSNGRCKKVRYVAYA